MNNLQIAIDFFNSRKSKTKITRNESLDHTEVNGTASKSTFDNYRLYLTNAGYLNRTKDKGVYQINKKIPTSITLTELYQKSYGWSFQ